MSILSVDNISPIGSGTSVTINNAATLVLNNLNVAGVSTFTGLVDCNGGARIDNIKLGIDTNEEISTQVGNLTLDSASGTVIVTDDLSVVGVSTFTTANSTIGAVIKNTAHDSQLQILATYSNKNSVLLFGDAADDDIGKIDYDHNTDNMIFTVDTDEVFRIDAGGRFLKGLTSAAASRSSTSVRYPHFQLSSPWSSGLGSYKIECTNDYPIIFIDSGAAYANGSGAGTITWSVKDSSGDYCNTASVVSRIDGTPSNDSAPGRLEFHTTTSGSTATVKMTISSEGYVTTPSQPSFNAYITGMSSESANTGTQIIPFNTTNTNVGGHFKTSGTDQYKFVAPVAGNYYFSLSQNHSARIDSKILKNGVIYHGGESETTSQNWWDHHHLSCIIPLAAGDKVHCTTNNQDGGSKRAWNSGYWDSFSGFLIG